MNAGTRYGEMSDTLQEVEVFVNGGLERLPADALGLRLPPTAPLPPGAVITRARLRLTPSSPEKVAARLADVDAARKGQPKVKSAGVRVQKPRRRQRGAAHRPGGLEGLARRRRGGGAGARQLYCEYGPGQCSGRARADAPHSDSSGGAAGTRVATVGGSRHEGAAHEEKAQADDGFVAASSHGRRGEPLLPDLEPRRGHRQPGTTAPPR